MASDTKSLKSTGGVGAEPKVFRPSDLAGGQDSAISGLDPAKKPSGSGKRIAAIIVAAVVVLGATAAAVYFFVLPLFSLAEPTPVVVPETQPSEQERQNEPPSEVPPVASFEHQSFFAGDVDLTTEVQVSSVTQGQILAVLSTGISESAPADTVQEVVFATGENPLTSSELLGAFLPNSGIEGIFEDDFTAFVYYDENGAWPGYVFSLPEEGDTASAPASVEAALEGGADLGAFYLADPGDPASDGFSDGKAGDINTRYLPYDASGASLNYGWNGNFLIISTSFKGFQKASELLP